jgi:hypothetical protein
MYFMKAKKKEVFPCLKVPHAQNAKVNIPTKMATCGFALNARLNGLKAYSSAPRML